MTYSTKNYDQYTEKKKIRLTKNLLKNFSGLLQLKQTKFKSKDRYFANDPINTQTYICFYLIPVK